MAFVERHVAAILLAILVALFAKLNHAAKILIPGSLNRGRGHTTLLCALSAELTSRGHHVTILVPSDDHLNVGPKFADSKADEILKYQSTPFEVSVFVKSLRAGNISKPGARASWVILKEVMTEHTHYCRQLLNNTSIMTRLKQERFDLIITDMVNGCEVLLPEVLQVPYIALTSNTATFMNFNIFGFPTYNLAPFLVHARENPASFGVRVRNFLIKSAEQISYKLSAAPFAELQRDFNISPDESIFTLANKAQFWLSQDFVVLEAPHPTMPNWSPVGGLAAARPGSLPVSFKTFVDESGEDGFILISVGSIVGGFDVDLSESIASVLSKLPHRVVWKHSGPIPKNLGTNTKVSPWLPQAALLAHPKVRLFIGHGGLNGIFEAIYNAVPMILIPQMLHDQYVNALRVERLGFGVHMDKAMYSADLFENNIKQVLNDKSFRDKIHRCSQILQDDDPMDRAVYWVEYILKFGGSHLRPEVLNLNFIQYYLLDIFAFLFSLIVVLVASFYYTCVCCCSLCKRSSNIPKIEKVD